MRLQNFYSRMLYVGIEQKLQGKREGIYRAEIHAMAMRTNNGL